MTPPVLSGSHLAKLGTDMERNRSPNIFPNRKSPRLKAFDYSSPNYYFITICTRERQCLFGEPSKLSPYGAIAADCLKQIEDHFPAVHLDKWVVMPNHVHAIIILWEHSVDLSTVVGLYKSTVTRKLRTLQPDLQVWQASFHDRIIRNQEDYERIWMYIDTNPVRWADDCFFEHN